MGGEIGGSILNDELDPQLDSTRDCTLGGVTPQTGPTPKNGTEVQIMSPNIFKYLKILEYQIDIGISYLIEKFFNSRNIKSPHHPWSLNENNLTYW